MSVELLIITKNDAGTGDVFNVSTLAHNISYFTTLESQAGKLSFTLLRDPNNILKLRCGSAVLFFNHGQGVFVGYIFNIKLDSKGNYDVTAFDQLRYLQNHDVLNVKEGTSLYDFLNIIMSKINYNSVDTKKKVIQKKDLTTLRYSDIVSQLGKTKYLLPTKLFSDNSYFDMINWAFTELQRKSTDEKNYKDSSGGGYNFRLYIYDSFGTLSVSQIGKDVYFGKNEDINEDLIIGDESLLTDYEIEYDINSNTYNDIVICKSVEASEPTKVEGYEGIVFPYHARDRYSELKGTVRHTGFTDVDTVEDFGLLQKVVNINDDATDEQVRHYADVALFAQNKVFKTFSLSAIGFNGLRAGSTFTLRLNKLGICHKVYANSVTHNYEGEKHTMDIEVCMGDNVLRDII